MFLNIYIIVRYESFNYILIFSPVSVKIQKFASIFILPFNLPLKHAVQLFSSDCLLTHGYYLTADIKQKNM